MALTAADLNRILAAGERRADDLVERLAAVLEPILDRAGDQAAAAFSGAAVDFMTAAASNPASTMVALYPRPEEAAALAQDDGEPAEILHVTVCYIGDTDDAQLRELEQAMAAVAGRTAALEGTAGGVGTFGPEAYPDGTMRGPSIVLPDVPGLSELRVAVTEALVQAGLDYSRLHGFCPHITLSYTEGTEVPPASLIGLPLHFDQLVVARGDVRHDLPFTGPAPITAGAVVAESDKGREVGEVAARHAPEGGYGDTYWNVATGVVFWVSADWTSSEEADAAEADFLAVDGVREVDDCAECGAPEGDEWERVYGSSALAETAAGDPSWAMPAPDEVLDVEALVRELRTKTDPVRLAAIETMMRAVLERVGISFDVTNPYAARAFASSGSQVRHIGETTRLNVMRVIRHSYEQGLSIPDTAKAIRAGMREATPVRARLIARTEMAGAVNGGSLAAARIVARSTGEQMWKKWLTAAGARHPRHATYLGLHGQVRELDEAFSVGGSSLDHPGDHAGPPHETVNCRCALSYTDDAEEVAAARSATPTVGPADAPVDADVLAKLDTLGLDGWPPVKGTTAQRVLGHAADTEELYGANGWEARRSLHDDILRELFADKDTRSPKPTAFFTAGGAASGKGSATFRFGRKTHTLEDLHKRADTLVIDPDEIKKLLPEYRRMLRARDPYAAYGVHEESSHLAKRAFAIAQARGLNVVVDGVGGSGFGKFVGKMHSARAAGYRVQVSMVSAPTNRAIERMVHRGERTGRYVQMGALRDGHKLSAARHLEWRDLDLIDRWTMWDTTGRPSRLVAEGYRGTIRVYDHERYARIVAKADE